MSNEEKKTDESTVTPVQFVSGDVLESYKKECNCKPTNPLDRYVSLIKLIREGKELLPNYDNPDEKDEDQKKKNKVKQDEKDELYKKAGMVLKTEIPAKRQIKYKYLDKGNRICELKAVDADTYEVVEDSLEIGLKDFKIQQHEQHISKLEEVHNQIYHVVTQAGIYPLKKPTINDILDKRIKERYDEGGK